MDAIIRIENTRKVNWFWVQGHSNSKLNNLADKYAVLSMKEQTNYRIENYNM